jgi:hypothetical protein
MKIQLPGIGKSVDAIIAEAFAAFGCRPLGGQSGTGWSKQSDLQRCPRRYQLKHELGATPLLVGEVSPGLDVGAVGHALLAVYYAAMLPDERYPGWQPGLPDPFALLQAMQDAGLPGEIYMVAEQCLSGYLEHWATEDVRPVAVEMSAGDAKFHTSRFDLPFYTEEGLHPGLWIGEHKFLKSGTDTEEYRMHGEILGEMLAWQLSGLDDVFGMPLAGVCLNVIFKPTKTLPPRFQRLWLPVPPMDHMRRYAEDRVYWLKVLLDCKQRFGASPWPRALLGCKKFRLCRYFAHCRDLDNSQLKFDAAPIVSEEE